MLIYVYMYASNNLYILCCVMYATTYSVRCLFMYAHNFSFQLTAFVTILVSSDELFVMLCNHYVLHGILLLYVI